MNNKSDKPIIFLYYDDHDLVSTEEIYDSLAREGFQPWMIYRDILPGDNIQEKIEETLENTDGVLFIFSENTVNSETDESYGTNKIIEFLSRKSDWNGLIIPVRLDACNLPLIFRDYSPANLFEKNGWSNLLSSLRNRFFPNSNAQIMSENNESPNSSSDTLKDTVFVAMPFDYSYRDLYYEIKHLVLTSGMYCVRVDQEIFTGDIIAWMNDKIGKAKLVIAEITKPNPNVYLEIGYALAKGIPVIFIARDKHITGEEHLIPFDIRTQKVIYYENLAELAGLLSKLKNLSGNSPESKKELP